MFAHLVPQGTPPVLMPFMVCIETISNVIRPGTLAVWLMANMVAGHLLLTLLGNTGASLGNVMVGGLLVVQVALLGLEVAVASAVGRGRFRRGSTPLQTALIKKLSRQKLYRLISRILIICNQTGIIHINFGMKISTRR